MERNIIDEEHEQDLHDSEPVDISNQAAGLPNTSDISAYRKYVAKSSAYE